MEEYLEIWDFEKAEPTGEKVERKKAHREGIPHEGVHMWIVRKYKGELQIVLQHRASHKQHYPGCFDITVGGHVPFGYAECKISKESKEEIGIIPEKNKLIHIDTYKYAEDIPEINLYHKEILNVYLYRDDRLLNEYSFNDGEVDLIAAISYDDFKEILFSGKESSFGEIFDGKVVSECFIMKNEFHPLFFTPPMYEYLTNLTNKIDEMYS